ncbi:hypothetical protein [Saccharothrix obliqua]|uniref:hypothetical protein n=1 Tax=Saccharothrix obliqua TaxID=2861747 RepID=UPI001C5F5DD2|nr:hypothetical protein [Saccharothrix obliqua]MBW4718648.1 hypothetical protein [Saccharothrix obliqua]
MDPVRVIGSLHGVEVAVAVTDAPWELGVDVLVVSVGSRLGDLGLALAQQVKSFRVDGVDLAGIPADRPRGRALDPGEPLRHVVLASPHSATGEGVLSAVAVATRAGVLAAARTGAASVALPLPATGALGAPHEAVAAVAVPALRDALRSAPRSLRRVVFVGRQPDLLAVITTRTAVRRAVARPARRGRRPRTTSRAV